MKLPHGALRGQGVSHSKFSQVKIMFVSQDENIKMLYTNTIQSYDQDKVSLQTRIHAAAD